MTFKNQIQGHSMAVFTTLVWGSTFVSTKVLLADFSPYEIIVYRLILAYLIFLVACPKGLPFHSWKQELLYASAAMTGVVLYQIFENLALTYSYASTAGVVITTAPMFTGIFACIFLKEEKLGWRFFAGFAIAMAGIYLVSVTGLANGFSMLGTLLALAAAALWGVYSILCKKMNDSGSIVKVTRRVFFYSLVYMIPTYFLFDCKLQLERFLIPVNALNMFYLGIVASALCFLIWNVTVEKIGVISTGLYLYAIPVVTVVFSAIILQEQITWMTVSGIILALGGLILSANRGGRKNG